MTRWTVLAALGICLLSAPPVWAAGPLGTVNGNAAPGSGEPLSIERVQYNQAQWHPIGCVRSAHDCEHLAHSQGHHHHRVVRDHHACQNEPHLLCIAAG